MGPNFFGSSCNGNGKNLSIISKLCHCRVWVELFHLLAGNKHRAFNCSQLVKGNNFDGFDAIQRVQVGLVVAAIYAQKVFRNYGRWYNHHPLSSLYMINKGLGSLKSALNGSTGFWVDEICGALILHDLNENIGIYRYLQP